MNEFIRLARQDNVLIKLSPEYYLGEIDALVNLYEDTDNRLALGSSLGATIHTIAAMEGDWGNGEPKLEHAKNWMGSWFEVFKRLYPDKYKKLTAARR